MTPYVIALYRLSCVVAIVLNPYSLRNIFVKLVAQEKLGRELSVSLGPAKAGDQSEGKRTNYKQDSATKEVSLLLKV